MLPQLWSLGRFHLSDRRLHVLDSLMKPINSRWNLPDVFVVTARGCAVKELKAHTMPRFNHALICTYPLQRSKSISEAI